MQQDDNREMLRQAYEDAEIIAFNHSLICCIPKKPTGADSSGGLWYRAADTRPIAIVDTGNRLIANAAGIRWEKVVGKWARPQQNGFLPKRSILLNVVDLEEAAMRADLTEEAPAMFFAHAVSTKADPRTSLSSPASLVYTPLPSVVTPANTA